MHRSFLFATTLLAALTSACGPVNRDVAPASRGLEPVNQPVVTRTDYILDLAGGFDGLAEGEAARLDAWLRSLEAGYGDTLFVDDATPGSARTTAVGAVGKQYGLEIAPGAPVTVGRTAEGGVRVVLSRSEAYVPGCPKWENEGSIDYANAQSAGFGCGVNGSLAVMVADPKDLIRGRDSGGLSDTRALSSAKSLGSLPAIGLGGSNAQPQGGK